MTHWQIVGRLVGALALTCLLACGRTPIGTEGDDLNASGAFGNGSGGDGDADTGGDGDGDGDHGGDGDGDGGGDGDSTVPDDPDGPDDDVPPRPDRDPPAPPIAPRTCGDGVVQAGEACDEGDLGGLSCAALGLRGGRLGCRENCQLDTSRCRSQPPQSVPGVPDTPAGRACLSGTRALSPNIACADRLCACNLSAAQACDRRCWELIRCAAASCGSTGDFGCIAGACNIEAAETALALRPCLEAHGNTCGLFDGGPSRPFCGNGLAERGEPCDRFDLGGLSCTSFGLAGSGLRCTEACELDFDGCRPATPDRCGDGEVDPGEQCDGGDPRELDCADLGRGVGPLGCTSTCRLDFSDCELEESCGNGRIDPAELCDGNNLAGQSCGSFGLEGDGLACTPLCRFDPSACDPPPICGDGQTNGDEACDGDVGEMRCQDLMFTDGSLACGPTCELDLSGCTLCGNGRAEGSERCDEGDLSGQTCRTLGFPGGELSCDGSCDFDTTACGRCGNGGVESGESCDGADLSGQSCESLGLATGTLACDASCRYDTSGCGGDTGVCGNAVIETGEECDGMNLSGVTCATLGFDTGSLACNAETCRHDSSGCRFEVPDPEPTCMSCGQTRCPAAIEACADDDLCLSGLACLAESCGPNAAINCALRCFDGNLQSAIRAVGMFSCVVSQCGPACIGVVN